jgi:hypothetical protein
MSFLGRIGKFARSPQGKKLINEAKELAQDPHTKQRIEDARQRLVNKDKAQASKP